MDEKVDHYKQLEVPTPTSKRDGVVRSYIETS